MPEAPETSSNTEKEETKVSQHPKYQLEKVYCKGARTQLVGPFKHVTLEFCSGSELSFLKSIVLSENKQRLLRGLSESSRLIIK